MSCSQQHLTCWFLLVQFSVDGIPEDTTNSRAGQFTAYGSLKALHLSHTFAHRNLVKAHNIIGGKLSLYTHVEPEGPKDLYQRTFFGRIVYFKVNDGCTANDAIAVMTREPCSVFGSEHFEQPAYKLAKLSASEKKDQDDKVKSAVPHKLEVKFDRKERAARGPTMTVIANSEPLPRAEVRVLNRKNGPSRWDSNNHLCPKSMHMMNF